MTVKKIYETPLHEFVKPVHCENTLGNCGACAFRNAPKFCEKLTCDAFDGQTGEYVSVYWYVNGFGINPLLQDWLRDTPERLVKQAAADMINTASQLHLKKAR